MIDSNAAQFARKGNPWYDPQNLGNFPVSRGQMKQNRKVRGPRVDHVDPIVPARELTPAEALRKRQFEMLKEIRRLRPPVEPEQGDAEEIRIALLRKPYNPQLNNRRGKYDPF